MTDEKPKPVLTDAELTDLAKAFGLRIPPEQRGAILEGARRLRAAALLLHDAARASDGRP